MTIKTILKFSALALVIVLGLIAIFAFVIGGDGSGKPVPPPRTVSFDFVEEVQGIAEGETITIQAEQLKNAGIQSVLPEEMLTSETLTRSAVGVVETDAYQDTPVVAPAMGRAVEVIGRLGDRVTAGQVLALLEAPEFANAQTAFITARAELENARQSSDRAGRLSQVNDEVKGTLESARRDLVAAQASFAEAKNRSERADRLFEAGAISRQVKEEENRKYQESKAAQDEAEKRFERASSLLDINNEPKIRIEEARLRLRRAEGEFEEAKRRLAIFGVTEEQMGNLRSLEDLIRAYPVRSPISGEITKRELSKGELVESSKEVFRVTDLSRVWIIGQVTETDASQLRVGIQGGIALQNGGQLVTSGRLTYISPILNEATRTAQVRIEVDNSLRQLRIGSYVRVSFKGDEKGTRSVPSIPTSAVQTLKGNSVVFIPKGEAGEFEVRVVKVGAPSGSRVPVLEGLELDERVVTTGSFLLRAEYLKRTIN